MGPDCPQQEGPTLEGGGLQPSCHLTQQIGNSEEVVVDQPESTAKTRNSEEVVVDRKESMAVK